jgi:hypothetical protein
MPGRRTNARSGPRTGPRLAGIGVLGERSIAVGAYHAHPGIEAADDRDDDGQADQLGGNPGEKWRQRHVYLLVFS